MAYCILETARCRLKELVLPVDAFPAYLHTNFRVQDKSDSSVAILCEKLIRSANVNPSSKGRRLAEVSYVSKQPTAWSKIIFKKLIVVQLIKKFHKFYVYKNVKLDHILSHILTSCFFKTCFTPRFLI
jgi:hypothetical protein